MTRRRSQRIVLTRCSVFSCESGIWSSQDLVDTLSPPIVSRFKLLWTDTAEMTVAGRSIVEAINVFGHVGLRQFSVL